LLPAPFRRMGAWRNSTETQQSGHAPRFGPEVKNGRSSAKDGVAEVKNGRSSAKDDAEEFHGTQQLGHVSRSGSEFKDDEAEEPKMARRKDQNLIAFA